MRTRFPRLLAAAGIAWLVLAFAGCGSSIAPSVYCYQVTAATVHGVDVGMTVAGDLYAAGKLPEATKVKLVAAHDVYRPAAQAVVAGCKAVQDQASADKLAADVQKAADGVLRALVAAGVK